MIVGEKRVESERVERVKEFERGLKMRRDVCCKKVDIIIMRIIYKGAKINKKQLGKRIKSKSFLNLKPPSFPLSFSAATSFVHPGTTTTSALLTISHK